MKAVTPIISTIILVVVVLTIASLFTNFMLNLSQRVSQQAGRDIDSGIRCNNAGIGLDSGFGTVGVDWDFSGPDKLDVMVVNTGTVSLYGFSIEATIGNGTIIVRDFDVRQDYQRARENPLKPGQRAILKSNITSNVQGTLQAVRVINEACPSVIIERTL